MRSPEELSTFIEAHTALKAPPALPEVKLHIAVAITPLWQASERFLEGMEVARPYWAFAWAGGQGLARHLIENKWLVRGRRVLDFMAGSGIAGIAAAVAGAGHVEAYESDPLARAAIALNARSNQVEVEVTSSYLVATDAVASWEVVLVGDVGYEPAVAEKCLPWLRSLAAKGALVLMADPGGAFSDMKGLVRLGEYEVPTSFDPDDPSTRETTIFRIAA
jgi:predicted nicotinamide N-methyase